MTTNCQKVQNEISTENKHKNLDLQFFSEVLWLIERKSMPQHRD